VNRRNHPARGGVGEVECLSSDRAGGVLLESCMECSGWRYGNADVRVLLEPKSGYRNARQFTTLSPIMDATSLSTSAGLCLKGHFVASAFPLCPLGRHSRNLG
jgi:hypothetical protein